MKVTLEYIEQENQSVKTFWFRPERPIKNVPGQFTELYLPHKNPDSRGQKRWFTIFSSPTEDLFAITTRFAPKSSSFKHALGLLEPGTQLEFAEPMGDFILPKDKSIPLLFIAGGIGITPFRSIAKWLADTNEVRDITLMHAVRDELDLLFLDTLNQAKFNVMPIVSNPGPVWAGHSGNITAEMIASSAIKPNTHIYLSGPELMLEKLTKEVVSSGIPKRHVITDYFPGYMSN